jgi:DNA-binding NarL/FixJ family response regulator
MTLGPASWGPRVLLVEDDTVNRRLLRELLSAEGVLVVGEAGDGQQGAELALSLKPDVVLMDLRMPVVAGMGATRLIKQALPTTQVVILTTYEGPLLTRSTRVAGAYAYLVKGCSPQVIRDTVFQAWRYKLGLDQHARSLKDDPRKLG